MLRRADDEKVLTPALLRDSVSEAAVANRLGRRYECATCGSTVLCTKAGEGTVQCHGADMTVQEPRKLPSSD